MVVRGSVWRTHFNFGLMVVTWSIPSGLPGSRIITTISQSAWKWRLMAETGTTQFAQWNALLFVRKKIRWGKRISIKLHLMFFTNVTKLKKRVKSFVMIDPVFSKPTFLKFQLINERCTNNPWIYLLSWNHYLFFFLFMSNIFSLGA